jgi:hypothetical protein
VLFGVDSSSDSLSTINPGTGVATTVGPLDPDADAANNLYTTPIAMAVHPIDGTLFVWNNSSQIDGTPVDFGRLVTVNKCTGAATPVNAATPDQGAMHSLAFSPGGVLYGVGSVATPDVQHFVFTINTTTGVRTPLFEIPSPVYGMDFMSGTLYGVVPSDGSDPFVSINPSTGAFTTIGDLSSDIGIIGSIAFTAQGTLAGAGFGGTSGDILFDIDLANGVVSNVRTVSGNLPQGMGFSTGCVIIE